MEAMLYYTVAGIALYLLSDWILVQMEKKMGRIFPQRSVVFFFIILALSMALFQVIERLA